jgi:hypothetical protein
MMHDAMPKQCSVAMLQALQVEQCTYVRTYSQRTTYVDLGSHVSNARRGAARFTSLDDENQRVAVASLDLMAAVSHA